MKSLTQRRAGVLLHPTSFPSGGLDDALRWLDWMADAGFRIWQFLPLGVPHDDFSPYQCLSAFALHPGLLPQDAGQGTVNQEQLQLWRHEQAHWVEEYALFMALRWEHNTDPWFSWPHQFRNRNQEALVAFAEKNRESMDAIIEQQFVAHRYWLEIREAAADRDILLFGDMPIFVAHDSADVWSNPHQFMLDDDGLPTFVAGVPPDYFSEEGQRWGNPQYNWEAMNTDGFRFWIERLHHHFELFDLVRLDHFRGLEAVWTIPAENETAIDGYWEKTPGDELLARLQQEMGCIPLIAEDLGIITPEVTALRKKYELPGMAVLQFGFDAFDDNPHKLHNIHRDTVVYTGTHDNDTIRGWYDSLDDQTRGHVLQTIGAQSDEEVVDCMIDAALGSNGNLAIVPLQDLLGLGNEARMNLPGTVEGNWQWRFTWEQLANIDCGDLKERIQKAGRLGE
jgi:4-alpha-glucanotransferase